MTQAERRRYLIDWLLREGPDRAGVAIPADEPGQRLLLRALLNVRPPRPVSREFLEVQDAYLQQECRKRGVTELDTLTPVEEGLYLWQGDITTLRCDAIVNAANAQLLGCFYPLHSCIDNIIHSRAGVQLRLECARQMRQQGHDEPNGRAKITPGYNLPSRYVLHTVGPQIRGRVTGRDRAELAGCYRACLTLAAERGLESVAFCCISTGEFHFPHEQAARIAVDTVREFRRTPSTVQKIVFNVFKDTDRQIYQALLPAADGR